MLTGAGRAAQCAAPTIQPEHPGRAGLGPASTKRREYSGRFVGVRCARPRAAKGRPYRGKRTGSVGSAKPGANVKPHHLKFSTKPGPQWARKELQSITQILRAGNTPPSRRDDPRNGGLGVRRIWTRSVHIEPFPSDSLVTFSSLRKSLAVRRRRNFPALNAPKPKAAPSSVTLRVPPSLQGEGLKGQAAKHPLQRTEGRKPNQHSPCGRAGGEKPSARRPTRIVNDTEKE